MEITPAVMIRPTTITIRSSTSVNPLRLEEPFKLKRL
jgi:hypothetical protein